MSLPFKPLLIALPLLAGCSDPPAVAGKESASVATAPAPRLAPTGQILAAGQTMTLTDQSAQALSAQADALRARAAALPDS